jgi:hypothetical protein
MKTFRQEKNLNLFLALVFLGIGIGFRLVPHLPNFTPIAAIALFGGVYFQKKLALILPLVALFFSDWLIGFYEPSLMVMVYGSFFLTVLLGFWLKQNKKWYTVGGAAVGSAVLFFIITNFAVWAFTPWYAKSLSGLVQCYIMAVPFFRNTLLGNLFYVPLFFGGYEIVKVWAKRKLLVLSRV